jgi:hypothetical protein
LKLSVATAEHQPAIDFKERLEKEVENTGKEIRTAENEIKRLDREVKILKRQDDEFVRPNWLRCRSDFLTLILRQKVVKRFRTKSSICAGTKMNDSRKFVNFGRKLDLLRPKLMILRISPRLLQSWKKKWFVV